MNFENEQSLVDAGFVLTPNVFNSGIGSGKVYAKSFPNVEPFTDANVEGGFHYDMYSVDPNGVVAPYVLAKNVVEATPEATVVTQEEVQASGDASGTEPEPTPEVVAEVTPEATPEVAEAEPAAE